MDDMSVPNNRGVYFLEEIVNEFHVELNLVSADRRNNVYQYIFKCVKSSDLEFIKEIEDELLSWIKTGNRMEIKYINNQSFLVTENLNYKATATDVDQYNIDIAQIRPIHNIIEDDFKIKVYTNYAIYKDNDENVFFLFHIRDSSSFEDIETIIPAISFRLDQPMYGIKIDEHSFYIALGENDKKSLESEMEAECDALSEMLEDMFYECFDIDLDYLDYCIQGDTFIMRFDCEEYISKSSLRTINDQLNKFIKNDISVTLKDAVLTIVVKQSIEKR